MAVPARALSSSRAPKSPRLQGLVQEVGKPKGLDHQEVALQSEGPSPPLDATSQVGPRTAKPVALSLYTGKLGVIRQCGGTVL